MNILLVFLLLITSWIMGSITHNYPFKRDKKVHVVSWLSDFSLGKKNRVEPLGCSIQLLGIYVTVALLIIELSHVKINEIALRVGFLGLAGGWFLLLVISSFLSSVIVHRMKVKKN